MMIDILPTRLDAYAKLLRNLRVNLLGLHISLRLYLGR